MVRYSRRRYLAALGTVAIAGCIDATGRADAPAEMRDGDTSADDDGEASAATNTGGSGPPTSDRSLPLPDGTGTLSDSIVSGGVPKDGIPSIDEPQFLDGAEADGWLDDGEPVFGVVVNGDVRAYPQRVLVWHEIVNDEIGGENLAVTYCPLTGTAQGFERGETEFGVSGNLLNSNLVMYDRATDSYWPQMLATAIRGDLEGSVLREFPVTWTTWERWRDTQPETIVLSDETGFARNYDSDPYGSYNPLGGFYSSDSLIFSPYTAVDDSAFHVKEIVLGARTEDGSVAVHKASLAEANLLETEVGDVPYVAIYEPSLDTGYVYRNPDAIDVTYDDGVATVEGDSYRPDDLPLERIVRYDAFWFAWAGYYPETEVLQ